MDSRNITTPTPVIEGGRYLEEIYKLQKQLLSHYIKLEGLPQYPLNVNSKKSQIILKDFTARIIEELAEGFESQLRVETIAERLGYFQTSDTYPNHNIEEGFKTLANDVQNINEELSDSLHFMMELLIYANILSEDILSYLKNVVIKQYPQLFLYLDEYNILESAMIIGRELVHSTDVKPSYTLKPKIGERYWSNEAMPIGWNTSPQWLSSVKEILWDVTYSLSISRNCLKNKPWKQTQELTDEAIYQNLIAESFIKLLGYFSYIGLTSQSLFSIYFKKNCVNQFRIKSKY